MDKNLEKEVDEAAIKGAPIDFNSKTIKECKYIQKYAEIKLSHFEVGFTVIIFTMAIGASYVIAFIGSSEVYGGLYRNSGLILLFIGFFIFYLWLRWYNNVKKIILDAEKRLLSED